MAGLAKNTAKKVIKRKKHGPKKFVRPSEKKSVKNGRHQEKEAPKKKVTKAVQAIPDGLDGAITDDEIEETVFEHEHDAYFDLEELDTPDILDGGFDNPAYLDDPNE